MDGHLACHALQDTNALLDLQLHAEPTKFQLLLHVITARQVSIVHLESNMSVQKEPTLQLSTLLLVLIAHLEITVQEEL